MKYFKSSKLIRDNILESMKSNNQDLRGVRTLSDDDFIPELKNKLVEEIKELISAKNKTDLVEEIADVQEVIDYLLNELKVSVKLINELKAEKVKKNGGFDKRIYIEEVGVEEYNKWYSYFKKNPEKYPEVI